MCICAEECVHFRSETVLIVHISQKWSLFMEIRKDCWVMETARLLLFRV